MTAPHAAPLLDAVIVAVLQAALLLGVPLLPLAGFGLSGWSRLDKTACVLGALTAPLLLRTLAIDHFSPVDVFATGGPWDIGYVALLWQRLAPLWAAPLDLGRALADDAPPDLARLAVILGAAIVAVALPWHGGHWRGGVPAAGRRLFLVLWSSYATLYAVSLVAWVANRLGFWCFLVLLLASLLVRDE